MRERDHHVLRGDQVLGVDVGGVELDHRLARIAELGADRIEFVIDQTGDALGPRQDVEQIGDGVDHFSIFLHDLVLLQPGEALQAHLQNFLGLGLGEPIAALALAVVAALTVYSATLFPRLVAAVPGAVLFGDVGEAAAGARGRSAVYAVIYTLDATRCIILHLAATQSLQHALGSPPGVPFWWLGGAVAVGAWALAQVRALTDMSAFLAAGTAGQVGRGLGVWGVGGDGGLCVYV